MNHEKLRNSLKKLADDFATLDGKEGKGGGLVKRPKNRWMFLSALMMRNYVIYNWLEKHSVDPEEISDVDIKNQYVVFLNQWREVFNKSIIISRLLQEETKKLTTQKNYYNPTSWYADEDYWECSLAIAGFGVSIYSGNVMGILAFGITASSECRDLIDKYSDD